MIMTSEEIIREYRQAKTPLKQIGILADQNSCSKQVIVEIQKRGGCTLPQQFDPERNRSSLKKKVIDEPVNPALTETKVKSHFCSARRTITKLIETTESDEQLCHQIEGVLAMLWEVIS